MIVIGLQTILIKKVREINNNEDMIQTYIKVLTKIRMDKNKSAKDN